MKKLLIPCILLCIILCCSCIVPIESESVPPSSADSVVNSVVSESMPTSDDSVALTVANDPYSVLIQSLEDQYGVSTEGSYYKFGLVEAERIDFDHDGVDELLCVCSTKRPEERGDDAFYTVMIYSFASDTPTVIYEPRTSNYGSGLKPALELLQKGDIVYYVYIHDFYTAYLQLVDGSFKKVFSYENYLYKNPPYYVNDTEVSAEEQADLINEFLSDSTPLRYSFYIEGKHPEGFIPVSVYHP